MKAIIAREYQRNTFWNSSLRELPIYVEYDGSDYDIGNGHTVEIDLNPNVKHLRFVIPNAKKTMTDDVVDLVKTVVFKDMTDIKFNVKLKGIFKVKLHLETDKKVKIKNR